MALMTPIANSGFPRRQLCRTNALPREGLAG
jgi:hypothetical protein